MDLVEKQQDCLLSGPVPAAGRFAAVADLWDRHVGLPEDGRLADPAFLGAETAARRERVAQIKFVPVRADPAGGLRRSVEGAQGLPRHGDLRLAEVALAATTVSADPCDPCATSIPADDGGTGNHLFRLEVHESPYDRAEIAATGVTCASPEGGGAPDSRIVVKFSKDNGSLEVSAADSALLTGDATFATAVFEVYDLASEQQPGLALHPRLPRRGRLVTQQGLAGLSASDLDGKTIRVWDGAASLDLANPNLAPAPVGAMGVTGTIERGPGWTMSLRVLDLDLTLTAQPRADGVPFILPGDAFAVDIREYAATPAEALAHDAEPVEIAHRYAFLGDLRNGAFAPETPATDLRSRAFPALTDLAAQDVDWSNHHHPTVATRTVQGAIDLLFSRDVGGDCLCTLCIDPGKDLGEQLRAALEALRAEAGTDPEDPFGSALICLPKGLHVLLGAVEVNGLRHLTFQGAGAGTTEIRLRGEGGFVLSDCESVTFADLAVTEQGGAKAPLLTFKGCDRIALRDASFAGEAAVDRKDHPLPLVLIHGDSTERTSGAEVRGCRFGVPTNRLALQIEGMGRQVVTDCLFEGGPPQRRTRRFNRVASVLEGIQVVAKPRGFVDDPKEGFAAIEGNPNLVYDLSALPPPDREPALRFLSSAAGRLGLEAPASVEAFDRQKSAIEEVGRVVLTPGGTIAGARDAAPSAEPAAEPTTEPSTAPAGDGGPTITGRARRLASGPDALRRRIDRITDDPPLVTVIPVEGGLGPIRPGDIQVMIDPDRPVTIDRAGRDGLLGDFDTLFRETSLVVYQRNFGLWLEGGPMTEARVTGNRFEWVHSAIVLRLAPVDPLTPFVLPAGRTTIRDNMILRAPLIGRTRAIVGGETLGAAIVVLNGGYLTLADNTVEQIVADEKEAAQYVEYLSHGDLQPQDEGFAAIRLGGLVGPVVHATANDAAYFRHALLIDGEARWQAGESRMPWRRGNLWTFRDNTVLPVLNLLEKHMAVTFIPDLPLIERRTLVRVGLDLDDYNHPWWLDG